MSEYRLINPTIRGNITNLFTGKTHMDAARRAWDTLSGFITNTVPMFPFTIENTKNGRVYSYLVKESEPKEKQVEYEITQLENIDKKDEKKLKKDSKQKGGKYTGSSEGDANEVFDILRSHRTMQATQPIVYLWYDPMIYKLPSVYIPTFVPHLTPYIEIATIKYYPN